MSSKLIHSHTDFFKKLVVDAVQSLDKVSLNEKMIGMKKVPGGGLEVPYRKRALMSHAG